MRIQMLGSFQLMEGGRQITVGGVRQRTVLADLLLNANEVVPSERLLIDLWGEDSPPSAANALQAAISRVRRVLPPDRLITTGSGYMLRIFPSSSRRRSRSRSRGIARSGDDALARSAAGRFPL
jgi:DNA-binding SARP family transcriptional activator